MISWCDKRILKIIQNRWKHLLPRFENMIEMKNLLLKTILNGFFIVTMRYWIVMSFV